MTELCIPVALAVTLDTGVPLEIERLRTATRDQMEVARVRAIADLRETRASIEFLSGNTGETCASLIRSLAVLAYAEGGVTVFGRHWCADHSRCIVTERMLPAKLNGDGTRTVELWIGDYLHADHPERQWDARMDGHLLHTAGELEVDGWHREGGDYVRRQERTGDGWRTLP